MSFWEALVLGIVQGLTEFAPVSSSAHLVLVPWALGWPSPGLAFDTMLHLGTLLAVVLVFINDLWQLFTAWARSLLPPFRRDANATTAWLLLFATIPAAVAGLLFGSFFEALFETPIAVAVFLLVTAAILTLADTLGRTVYDGPPSRFWPAMAIGLAQAAAIAPGISRSGSTISVGMLMGLTRPAAARFSFLLSVPIILGAGLSQSYKLSRAMEPFDATALGVGFLASAVTGYLCIRFLLRYLAGHSLRVFAIYCAGVGIVVLGLTLLPSR